MRQLIRNDSRQVNRGFSLIEFMVAVVLGIIIIGGAISVYVASKRSFTEVEQVADLSENGRFALQMMTESMRHVSFFGAANPGDVRIDSGLDAVTGDCTGQAAAYDLTVTLFAGRSSVGGAAFGCIDDAVPNTDVLVIKSVLPRPLYDADPEDPNAPRDGAISFPAALNAQDAYVIANSEGGVLLDGADTAPGVGEGNEIAFGVAWPYRLQVFYLRAGDVPTLSRKVLGWDAGSGSMEIQTEDLVQGVENMRLRLGFDSNGDGEIDTYNYEDVVTANNLWNQVDAVEIFLLMRGAVADVNYEDERTYQVGDLSVTPADNFRRLLLNSNVSLRNPKLAIRGGR